MTIKTVEYHSPSWINLTLEGWITGWVERSSRMLIAHMYPQGWEEIRMARSQRS